MAIEPFGLRAGELGGSLGFPLFFALGGPGGTAWGKGHRVGSLAARRRVGLDGRKRR